MPQEYQPSAAENDAATAFAGGDHHLLAVRVNGELRVPGLTINMELPPDPFRVVADLPDELPPQGSTSAYLERYNRVIVGELLKAGQAPIVPKSQPQ
jgi:hypothetical protein